MNPNTSPDVFSRSAPARTFDQGVREREPESHAGASGFVVLMSLARECYAVQKSLWGGGNSPSSSKQTDCSWVFHAIDVLPLWRNGLRRATTTPSANNGSWHAVHLLHVGIGKAPGGLLTIQKVKKEASRVLSERSDPLLKVFWREPSKMAFTNSISFVTDGSFTADVGLLYPTRCVKTTPQMTRFRDAKVCNNLATDEIDDHRIQSDYNKNCNIQKERTRHLVLRMRGEDSRHQ